MEVGRGAQRVRVLLIGLRPIVQKIIHDAIVDQPDIDVIEVEPTSEPAAIIAEWCPDVVVVPAAAVAEPYYSATRQNPAVRVVQVAQGPVDMYGVRLLAANPGPAALANAIRSVVAQRD